jgi:hypothetical protein
MNTRTAGAGALVVGAVLALVGASLPLYRQVRTSKPFDGFEFTAWDFRTIPEAETNTIGGGGGDPHYGVPLVAAGVLLVVVAVVLLRAANTSPRVAAVARTSAAGAALLLTGAAWAVSQVVLAFVDNPVPFSNSESTVGVGLWLLLGGVVAALAGAVLVQELPSREPAPTGPAVYRLEDDDTDTPPLGIPVHPSEAKPSTVEPEPADLP